ncbi:MAG: M23 family metallopeptidase [Bacteroidales bacterium]|nr:M23 family metallopeptidase [Bacteroidales bacterium]
MEKYKFNRDKLEFVEEKRGVKWWLKRLFQYVLASLVLAILYYIVFSLVFSTDEERRVARENRIMEQEYAALQQKLQLLDNTVNNLKYKDREIYRSIFNADPLIVSLIGEENSLIENIDTTRDDMIISKSKECLMAMEVAVDMVKDDIASIVDECDYLGESVRYIPSIVPMRGFSIGQTGASVGKKINPFYKTVSMHNGMDLLGAVGTDVLSAADGVVEVAKRSKRGEGNSVVINHRNGYVTTYSHLGDVLVRKGQKVKQGDVIARVGLSGMSFAPHLHYEISFNGKIMDPVNYFFAELSPEQYKDMVAASSNTGQSLD